MLFRGLFGGLFFVGSTRVMDSLNIFNFPAKKLRKKYGRCNYACAIYVYSFCK